MGLYLNFAAGSNQLPEPWQNLDPTHDIRKPLRFENGTAAAVLAGHVIQNVPFLQALGFFRECLRVLEPGGVLRISFADVGRFLAPGSRELALNKAALRYADDLNARNGLKSHGNALERTRAALLQILTGSGCQTAWTEASAAGALLVVGFTHVCRREYGHGVLKHVDGRHLDVGEERALLESTILEALK